MTLLEYLDRAPFSAADFARTLGVEPPLLSQWRNGTRRVPPARCVAIERATKGVVTRRDLRPHDWHLIWPELVMPTE